MNELRGEEVAAGWGATRFVNENWFRRQAARISRGHGRRIYVWRHLAGRGEEIQARGQDSAIAGNHLGRDQSPWWNRNQAGLHRQLRLTWFLGHGVIGHLDGVKVALGCPHLANLVGGRVERQHNGGIRRAEDAQIGRRQFGRIIGAARSCCGDG